MGRGGTSQDEIWIVDTKSVRVGETVFFKHKYLTQSVVTMSDTILRAGNDLRQALKGCHPQKWCNENSS